MKKEMIKPLGLLYVAVLFLGILAVSPSTKAAPGIEIYVPEYTWDTNTVPEKFNVTVWVRSDASFKLMVWQVYMTFDHRYINVTEVDGLLRVWPRDELGGRGWDPQYVFYKKTGGITPPPAYTYEDLNLGSVMVSDVLTAEASVTAGTYKLCSFEFAVKAMPSKGQSLESILRIDYDLTFLYDALGEIPGVVKTNGYYRLDWAKPGPARLNIVRADGKPWPLVFEKWWEQVGQTFVASVYIENLSPAWGITGANFTLHYNSTLISTSAADVAIDPLWAGPNIVDDSVPGALFIEVTTPPDMTGGNVHVADITFTVIYQGSFPDVDVTDLWFDPHFLWNHVQLIDTETPGKGRVVIEGYLALPLAWFEVYQPNPVLQGANTNDTVIGPAPSLGKIFEVQIKINNLYPQWFTIAWQCRLFFDPTLIEFVEGIEGPFLQNPRWNWYGTIFACNEYIDPITQWSWVIPFPGPHVAVGGFLLPNPATAEWDQTEFPNTINPPIVDNTLATLKFKVKEQLLWPQNRSCVLGLTGFSEWLLDKNGNYVPVAEEQTINGTYTILGSPAVGRKIDLYGGANNAGHGVVNAPFPEPYGGQGPNAPMDLVIPQSEVYLFAKVTYNMWPVQSKLVNFEIEGPFEKNATGGLEKKSGHKVWAKLTAVTNGSGIASLVYRMPWPCEDPYSITGIWKITATCNLYDVVVTDTMIFYYEDLLTITKVTTDKYYYAHGEVVKVTVEYATHFMQKYNATFAITITDEVGVPIVMALLNVTIGGARFCTLEEGRFTVELEIPKWAAAGYAYVHVNCYDKDPTEGGFAWCPEYTPPPEIYIMPV